MLQAIIENQYGEQLNLCELEGYIVTITGLTPPSATINRSAMATKDGSVFNSSKLNDRNIVIQITPRNDVGQKRINLYKYIKSKHYVKLYIKTDARDVWIEGYVESFEGNLYENPQRLQVSIVCPDPYFKSDEQLFYEFSTIIPLFTFPFSISEEGQSMSSLVTYAEKNIVNPSDDETGVIIELHATGLALEPTVYNTTTNEQFTINHEFQSGDTIRINTRPGEKSLSLTRDGVTTNAIGLMEKGSNWFKLNAGDNIFSYTTLFGSENLQLRIILQPIYEGV